jgi:hypothetical protein
MQQFKILHPKEGVKLIAVKVPEGARTFAIELDALFCHMRLGVYELIKLPEGNWTILGLSTELTEEQCIELMPIEDGLYYFNYTKFKNLPNYRVKAKESFASFLSSEGVEEPCVLLRKL